MFTQWCLRIWFPLEFELRKDRGTGCRGSAFATGTGASAQEKKIVKDIRHNAIKVNEDV